MQWLFQVWKLTIVKIPWLFKAWKLTIKNIPWLFQSWKLTITNISWLFQVFRDRTNPDSRFSSTSKEAELSFEYKSRPSYYPECTPPPTPYTNSEMHIPGYLSLTGPWSLSLWKQTEEGSSSPPPWGSASAGTSTTKTKHTKTSRGLGILCMESKSQNSGNAWIMLEKALNEDVPLSSLYFNPISITAPS